MPTTGPIGTHRRKDHWKVQLVVGRRLNTQAPFSSVQHGEGLACSQNCFERNWGSQCNMSLYFKLNAALRGRDEGQLKKYYPYCRLLFGGLSQMLPQRQTVYRALQRLPEAIWAEFFKMQPGDTFAFDTFTSTSTSKKGSLPFLGEKQKDNCRAFFTLEALSAFDIRAFSEFPCEEELMIPPGSRSEVVAVEQVTETEGGGDNIVGGTGLVYQALVNITARQMPLDPTVARCIDSEYSSSTTTQQTQQQPRPPPPQPAAAGGTEASAVQGFLGF
jgi:hypothetical protein